MKEYTTVRKKTNNIILSKLIEKKDLLASIQKPVGIFTVDGNRKGQYHQ
ncbi:MAG TPA: hypothetical protein VFP49_04130 [Nitrososphaeraceae archaeon]|jgi:hypothetical protein|nr:hypothetical protein [Nitrososphaeraceae archaeon]